MGQIDADMFYIIITLIIVIIINGLLKILQYHWQEDNVFIRLTFFPFFVLVFLRGVVSPSTSSTPSSLISE